jgi:Tfp pilus assembly protein PilO
MKKLTELTTDDILEFFKSVDKKTWIKIGAGSAVGAVLVFFIIYPAWIGRVEVKTQLEAIRGQVAQTNNLFRKKPELLRIKEEAQQFTQAAKEKMYTPSEASLLLGTISKMANDSKVSIVASKPKPPEGKFPAPYDALYESSLYDVTLEGGYHALGEFVSRIEANPKLLRIQSLSFHPRSDEEEKKDLLADVTLAAISVKQGKTS